MSEDTALPLPTPPTQRPPRLQPLRIRVHLRATDFLVLFLQALSVDNALVGKLHFEAEPTFY